MVLSASVTAQTLDYQRRYNILLDRVGPSGVGMETLIDNWSKAEPESADMLLARFYYYLSKGQGTEVVARKEAKYLGSAPMLTLKDSTGTDVHYYEVLKYDDELFGEAIKVVDKVISIYPQRLDFRFMKANAYIAYEKESPDMALAYLFSLIDEDGKRGQAWNYGDDEAEPDFFEEAMQEYCYSLYTIGSETSREAFRRLSEKLSGIYPANPEFINNIGSYYLLNHEYKTALKYYDKVLKKHPGDRTAMQNALLAAKQMKNSKLEKKYIKMLQQIIN